jgi:Domain of Unknown Function (DUF1080)
MNAQPYMISFAICFCGLLLMGAGCGADTAPDSADWTPLLDETLSEWEMYLGYKLPAGYAGEAPTDEQGAVIPPVGYNKNVNDVYSVAIEAGEPILRISGEYYGSLFTRQAFENYHFSLQVKWGDKKWDPRTELLRDSGILYHSIGEHGIDYYRAWMRSQEFQVMEGHMGDYWSLPGAAVDIRAFPPEKVMSPVASVKQPFLAFGKDSAAGGFCLRSADHESPPGEWTRLELVAFEDKSVHIVNGEVVMVLRNSRYKEGDAFIPLTRGQIQLQSEAAEVFYKDIKIRNIDALPVEYTSFFE